MDRVASLAMTNLERPAPETGPLTSAMPFVGVPFAGLPFAGLPE